MISQNIKQTENVSQGIDDIVSCIFKIKTSVDKSYLYKFMLFDARKTVQFQFSGPYFYSLK